MLLLLAALLLAAPAPEVHEGERLLADRGCLACHAAAPATIARLAPRVAPDLTGVGARVDPAYLARWLADPHGTRPGTAMPDVLAGVPPSERARAALELTHYLAAQGGPLDRTPAAAGAGELERGRQLYHSVGCVACHPPEESSYDLLVPFWEFEPEEAAFELPPPPAVQGDAPLPDLASKTHVKALARFLRDPLATRPDGRMPSLALTAAEARAIAVYLLRAQADAELALPERRPGLAYDYVEGRMEGDAPDLAALPVARRGAVGRLDALPEHRADHFGLRFHGLVELPARGVWRFHVTSDDGARVIVDGQLLVANDGVHPMTEASGQRFLEAGAHAIEVTYFEAEGGEGLVVELEGPGTPRQVLAGERLWHAELELAPAALSNAASFEIDLSLAAAGWKRFRGLRCASCHALEDALDLAGPLAHELDAPAPSPPLAALDPASPTGCLSDAPPDGWPRAALDDAERALARAALADLAALEAPLAPAERLARDLARLRCLACHERGGAGGVAPERRDFFVSARDDADLGDQARFPPPLDRAGRKLRRATLEAVLCGGERARPYLAARMPDFGCANVAHLPELFESLDLLPGDDLEPERTAERVALGRRLVGAGALGCIQCHAFAGFEAQSTPAVDLADVARRTRPGWFADLLRDPIAMGLNSRMPVFWTDGLSPVRDVYGGDPERQIAAVRAYLSLGEAAPLPEGLIVPAGAYELVPVDEPLLCGVFMEGVSPRTILVGTPEGLHYAFDVAGSRLAKLWRGRFFDAQGTWHARAGALERPPVDDVLDLPPGMALAFLPADDAPWPREVGKGAGFERVGHAFDGERYPVWSYRVDGVLVQEALRPELFADGLLLRRRLSLASDALEGELRPFVRLGVGERVARDDRGWWTFDGRLRVRSAQASPPPVVRETADGRREVIQPIAGGSIELELGW